MIWGTEYDSAIADLENSRLSSFSDANSMYVDTSESCCWVFLLSIKIAIFQKVTH